MSETAPNRGPLFPARDSNMPPPHLGGPPPAAPPPAPDMASSIERTVLEVFQRRLQGQLMPYPQARLLVALEQELILELTKLQGK